MEIRRPNVHLFAHRVECLIPYGNAHRENHPSYTEHMLALDVVTRLLEESPEVRLAYVFGSCAEGTDTDSSDLDLGILFSPDAGRDRLEKLVPEIERKVRRSVDLVDLRAAPPLLAHHIISRGKLLLCRDDDERVELVTWITARYLDTGHLRRIQNHYLRERAEERRGVST